MREIKIGRAETNDIVINDNSVSRLHASIIVESSNVYVLDHNSLNGTYINGLKIHTKQTLKEGDLLKTGNVIVDWRQEVHESKTVRGFVHDKEFELKPSPVQLPGLSIRPALSKQKKKSGKLYIGIGIILILLVITFLFLSDTTPGRWMKYMISPAKPSVVSDSKEENPLIGFDYRYEVKAKIMNNGSEGYVNIKTVIYECEKTHIKETKVKMKKGETYNHKVIFDEVEFLNGCITKSEIITSATY